MGVAGLVFEPPPPNFEKMHNFPRYTNDIIMKYGYFHWFKSLKKSLGVSFTDILVLLDLVDIQNHAATLHLNKSIYHINQLMDGLWD